MKLKIDYSSIIQGEFKPTRLNVMLVMQVNCPGCFLHAIPALIELQEAFKEHASFYILSTAFEDFEFNTAQNTRLLVEQGGVVGETRKALAHYGEEKYGLKIPFTVMFDRIIGKEVLTSDEMISAVSKLQQEAYGIPVDKQEEFSAILHNHFMSFSKAGYTFTANLLQGTPTFIVFDDNLEIISKWFGHKEVGDMIALLKHVNEVQLKSRL